MALAKPSGGWLCILLLPMMQAFAQTPGTPIDPIDPCTNPSLFDRSAGCSTSPNSNLERMDDALTELYIYYGVQAVISEQQDKFIANNPGQNFVPADVLDENDDRLVDVAASAIVAQLQESPAIATTLNEVLQPVMGRTCNADGIEQADLIICLLNDNKLEDTDRQTLREAFTVTAAALQELSPAPYDLAARSGHQLIRSLARLARNRLTRLHNSPPPADTVQLDGQSPLVASAAPTATTVALMGLTGMDVQARRAHYQANPLTAWAQGFSSYSSQDAENLLHDFEHRQNGLVVGADRKVGERLLAGGYLGGGVMDTSFAGGDNHEALLYSAGLYGMVIGPSSRRSYLDLELGLHYMDHDQQREIRLGGQRTTAQADYSALAFSLRAGTGIMFDIHKLILEPELSITYMYQNIDGFTESGDSPALLQVGEQQSQLVSWHAGINMHREFTTGGGNYVYTPRVGFHYLVETDLEDREIPARFAIIPGDSGYFTLRGRDNARHYYQQDIGINISSADGELQAHGDYTFIGNNKLTEHQFNVGLRYHFK